MRLCTCGAHKPEKGAIQNVCCAYKINAGPTHKHQCSSPLQVGPLAYGEMHGMCLLFAWDRHNSKALQLGLCPWDAIAPSLLNRFSG